MASLFPIAQSSQTGLTNNSGNVNLYTVPADGPTFFRIQAYQVLTVVGSISSTLPLLRVEWFDADTGVVQNSLNLLSTNSTNVVGTQSTSSSNFIHAQIGSIISFHGGSYASNAAGMTYNLYVTLEALM